MWVAFAIAGVLVAVVLHDLSQRKHAILRNYPVIGHLRYLLEKVGPELRQYIVTSNNEERPFSRDQRSWIYASSKRQNNYSGFGTDDELEQSPNFMIIKQSAFPMNSVHPESRVMTSFIRSRLPRYSVARASDEKPSGRRPSSTSRG